MSGMMKQMFMAGPGKTKIIQVPVPEIKDDEMLVRVTLSGMCHSEWYPWLTAKEGDLLGHESIGVVEKLGANVTGFHVGERVTGLGGGGNTRVIARVSMLDGGNISWSSRRKWRMCPTASRMRTRFPSRWRACCRRP